MIRFAASLLAGGIAGVGTYWGWFTSLGLHEGVAGLAALVGGIAFLLALLGLFLDVVFDVLMDLT